MSLRFTLSTASLFPWPLAAIFRLARDAGFDGVELVATPEVMLRGASFVAGLSRRFEVAALSLHAPLFPWPGWRQPGDRYARSLALAQELDIPVITFHFPRLGHPLDLQKLKADPLAALGLPKPQGDNPRVCWENPTYPPTSLRPLIRLFREGSFPLTFDFCHAGVDGGDALGLYQDVKERVSQIHLSDAKSRTIPRVFAAWPMLYSYLRTAFVEHQRPGHGVLPVKTFVACLRQDGYAGTVALELNPFGMGVWNPRGVLAKLRHDLDYCRQA